MSELIPAATVIPLRDADVGVEVLMLRKNSELAFGGMWVFPGGRVDEEDEVDGADEESAARRAAVREALEEADLIVDPDRLVPFSHWTPPEMSVHGPNRFGTWFFVCRAPVGEDGEVTIDGGEIHEEVWVDPTDMLRRRDEGEIQLAPPTVVTLHDLAAHDTVEAALDAAAARTPERFATVLGTTDEGIVTMWHGDAGYESGEADTPGPRHRIVLRDGPWRYERSS
ncbi:MAG: NUDIX domain-containing protein [Acidimicrobiales bacterium]|nr:NUDIX domain-containing protein [Acidimicrobiales bacterium]